jgi:hypothetical protein
MIGAGHPIAGQELAGEGAEAALHAVADHGPADLLGDGEADADRGIGVLTVADEKDEARHGRAPAAVGGEEIRALAKMD